MSEKVNLEFASSEELARFIKESKKTTVCDVYIKNTSDNLNLFNELIPSCFYTSNNTFMHLHGEILEIEQYLDTISDKYEVLDFKVFARNQGVPLKNISNIKARIEPGAYIRDHSEIGDNVVVMMGAVINLGVKIGNNTMIDFNAVLGARVVVGSNSHIGAGSVLAGVLEPPSAKPVFVGDNTLIGANAVILEGVRVGNNCVVAAGSIVTKDVLDNSVVMGSPARFVKNITDLNEDKKKILEDLRFL